jgi:hypothetical protein
MRLNKLIASFAIIGSLMTFGCNKDSIINKSEVSVSEDLKESDATLFEGKRTCAAHEYNEDLMAKDPAFKENQRQIEEFTTRFVAENRGLKSRAVITIPVVVHVVYKTSAENISDAMIQSQIDVLNADFRKLNADRTKVPAAFASLAADYEINFCLAKRTPTGLATNGIERKATTKKSFTTNDAVKSSSGGGLNAWDATKYLNLWSCNLSNGVLGYAQFPGGSNATDGVVILYSAFGYNSPAAPYNLGRTATHEVGHWLNLRHIWGDAACGNDQVADTPTQQTSNFGCPTYPHVTCSNAGDMSMNYMDYTNDACMYMFSTGQKARTQAIFAAGNARASLLSSNGCTPP